MKKIQDELDDVVRHDRVVNESDILQLKISSSYCEGDILPSSS
jgi:hypothetical protein